MEATGITMNKNIRVDNKIISFDIDFTMFLGEGLGALLCKLRKKHHDKYGSDHCWYCGVCIEHSKVDCQY
jgi:hypothetical protein